MGRDGMEGNGRTHNAEKSEKKVRYERLQRKRNEKRADGQTDRNRDRAKEIEHGAEEARCIATAESY